MIKAWSIREKVDILIEDGILKCNLLYFYSDFKEMCSQEKTRKNSVFVTLIAQWNKQ